VLDTGSRVKVENEELSPGRLWALRSAAALPLLVTLAGLFAVPARAYQVGLSLSPQGGAGVMTSIVGVAFALGIGVVLGLLAGIHGVPEGRRRPYLILTVLSGGLGVVGLFGSCLLSFEPYRAGVKAGCEAIDRGALRRGAEAAVASVGSTATVWEADSESWKDAPQGVRDVDPRTRQVIVGPFGVAFSLQGGGKTPCSGLWVTTGDPALEERRAMERRGALELEHLGEGVFYFRLSLVVESPRRLVGAP
jgi:hypothetical protein